MEKYLENILLSDHTTIRLGGKARYFLFCKDEEELIRAFSDAAQRSIPVQIISGGSNIIFPDAGYDGLVIKMDIKGVNFFEDEQFLYASVKAGENWDEFVKKCIEKKAVGVECLSGIPGSAGATPIQNVGAYGQEVSDTIFSVKAIRKSDLKEVLFKNNECDFGYRQSMFKNEYKDKFVVTEVTFRFKKGAAPEIKYQELSKAVDLRIKPGDEIGTGEKLNIIRDAVIELRKKKSMVIDESDPNSFSCGSFFMNPVLNEVAFSRFRERVKNVFKEFPFFRSGDDYKIPAAWLVERSGFKKGFVRGGVGISANHSLALINIGCTTTELISFSDEIENVVYKKFGIKLQKEPVRV